MKSALDASGRRMILSRRESQMRESKRIEAAIKTARSSIQERKGKGKKRVLLKNWKRVTRRES